MSIITFQEIKEDAIINIGKQLILAAKTAPKGRGVDLIEIILITGKEIEILSEEMKKIANEKGVSFFSRDADNIRNAPAVLIFGSAVKPLGLKLCGMCGFTNCIEKEKNPSVPCVFNAIDIGIAMGSVVSKAADLGVDNRIMYTIGQAAKNLKFLSTSCSIFFGIPLAAEAKNPFFDRSK